MIWSDACKAGYQDFLQDRFALYEINEKDYDWGLGCVPPAIMGRSAFLCGEPYTHNKCGEPVYVLGIRIKGHYYGGALISIREFKSLSKQAIDAAISLGSSTPTS